MQEKQLAVIARALNGYTEKFGIPRQSGRAASVLTRIVFEKQFGQEDAFRGIEDFSHLWLIWGFSENKGWGATVRPPRLGGNERMGVYATRSPFRPNGLGLSVVKLLRVEKTKNNGVVLVVSGADLMNNTPIYDIKPYIPYADSIPNAKGGFAANGADYRLKVQFAEDAAKILSPDVMNDLKDILAEDPRPAYHNDDRIYGLTYSGYNIRFQVIDDVVIVKDIVNQIQPK